MSVESLRLLYPILVRLAREASAAAGSRQNIPWTTYEDLCTICREVGIKETPRTIAAKLLKPLQALCLEHEKPDLSALVIQKPKARGDFGNLLRPSDGWWEVYVERGDIAAVGDVPFWFQRFKTARDYEEWPETPFF